MSHLGNDIVIEQAHEALLEESKHDCQMISICCGAEENEFVDVFCNACNEWAEFECVEWVCPARMPEIPEQDRK